MVLGIWLAGTAAKLYTLRTVSSARRLFLVSIIYLPLLLALMVLDKS